MKHVFSAAAIAGFAFFLGNVTATHAADITVLASNGIKAAVVELALQFEKATGDRLVFTWGASNLLVKKIEGGEAFDVVIVTPALIKGLIKQGKVVDGSAIDLARVGLGVAVKQGAPKPDISTVEPFKRAPLNAKAIAYSPVGQSGLQFISVTVKLGIADQVKAKGKSNPAGPAPSSLQRAKRM